jgi:predicted DNA-binding transcriptional regulator YafY
MARTENQKQKILALLDIFKEYTDDEHGITMARIIELLGNYGINAERKAVYKDIELLTDYGYEIVKNHENGAYCYTLVNRDFDLPELKLLVDAVQASKFISEKRSVELIKKIVGHASKYQAVQLQRQVYVTNRIKTDYDSVFYNIDDLNMAINQNKQIKFDYYEWNLKKEMTIRENGHKTDISPWALTWDDENYYMVAYDEKSKAIKHYRVDKIRKIQILDKERQGKESFGQLDMAFYAKKVFNMFTGDEKTVRIRFDNHMIGVVIDRFGKDIMVVPGDDGTFIVNVRVSVSNMFFGWIMGLGNSVKILGPDSVVEQFNKEIDRLRKQYEDTP